MQLQETLTKENFWNEMMENYPKATKGFFQWIDEYKEAVKWNSLFTKKYEFHEIPHAMQQGIWIEFVKQNLDKYFEQPEYSYSGDIEEDIKTVFSEIEELL